MLRMTEKSRQVTCRVQYSVAHSTVHSGAQYSTVWRTVQYSVAHSTAQYLVRGGRGGAVPGQQDEEEDGAQQVGPDVESLVVQGEDGPETLQPALRAPADHM